MRTTTNRRRITAIAGAVALAGGLSGVGMLAARATASFSLQRVAGTDRYLTAGAVDQAAYPTGEPVAFLADGVASHQADALAASGAEGVNGYGVLLTDNSTSVPQSTLTALSNNKVKTINVVGGTGSVTQAQIDQLRSDGFVVNTPYQGTDRWQTMELVDSSIPPTSVGKDSAGNPTAILASGDDNHLADALSAGGLAYAKDFPIILTESTSTTLRPEAQAVITKLGIKALIVAGGSAAVPQSQYQGLSGVSIDHVAAGKDRSATSADLSDYAIGAGYEKNTNLTVARGDDGTDALAGAALSGVKAFPTVITNSPTDAGSTTGFATEHNSTLAGTSYVLGGTSAVPDSQRAAIQQAGGGGTPGAPHMVSATTQGSTISLQYDQTVNAATVDADASDFQVTVPASTTTTSSTSTSSTSSTTSTTSPIPTSSTTSTTAATTTLTPTAAFASGSVVFIDMSADVTAGATPTVTVKNGKDSNTVCASGSTTSCEALGDQVTSAAATAAGTTPTINVVNPLSGSQKVILAYNIAIDCVTVDSAGPGTTPDYLVYNAGTGTGSGNPPGAPLTVASEQCSDSSGNALAAGSTTSNYVTIQTAGFGSGNNIVVQVQKGSDGNTIVASSTGGQEATPDQHVGTAS